MRLRLLANLVTILACATAGFAAAPIELELATERGVQITAPQEWLQLLAGIGIENVRIRGGRPGDEPTVANRGTDERPIYQIFGIITSRDQLRLTGGTFSRADRGRLKDYFDRLTADGAEALTAPRGMFGLTEKEIAAVFADLAQPIDFETRGQPLRAVMTQLRSKFASKLLLDAESERTLRHARPVADELKGVSAGTGLAMMLRTNGLTLRPEKSRGEPVAYRVEAAGSAASKATGERAPPKGWSVAAATTERAGRTNDKQIKHWPIGWEPHDTPGTAAPSLFQTLNAEIDGYTLAETLAAIGPRIKIPMYLDHASLAAHDIDPAKIQVRLPRTRTSYKRVIDRALSQARLGSQVRIDEAGNAFVWIMR
ncbi:MAG: hypothetical protein L0228_09225 [Planctomycetes bacterium]|nr:hypothetical protein [Planctomycetota bacterium]